jgi:GT2 family glycosyltransferase
MKTALLIPCFNRRTTTLHCLRHLHDLEVDQWASIVVVDDASTDGTPEAIRQEFPGIEIVGGSGDLWWGGAINLGMQHALDAGAEHVFWLNDDSLPRAGSLEAMLEITTRENAITTANGILRETGELHYGGMEKTPSYVQVLYCPPGMTRFCETLCGNCVCFPAAALRKIGKIDTAAFPHFAGDADFGFRATRLGIPIMIVGDAVCDCNYGQSKNRMSWLLGDMTLAELWSVCFHPKGGSLARCGFLFKWRHWGLRGALDYGVSLMRLLCVSLIRIVVPLNWLQRTFGSSHRVHQQMIAVKQWEEKHT